MLKGAAAVATSWSWKTSSWFGGIMAHVLSTRKPVFREQTGYIMKFVWGVDFQPNWVTLVPCGTKPELKQFRPGRPAMRTWSASSGRRRLVRAAGMCGWWVRKMFMPLLNSNQGRGQYDQDDEHEHAQPSLPRRDGQKKCSSLGIEMQSRKPADDFGS